MSVHSPGVGATMCLRGIFTVLAEDDTSGVLPFDGALAGTDSGPNCTDGDADALAEICFRSCP